MTDQQVDNAIDVGYAVAHADLPRAQDKCTWAKGVHSFLASLLTGASWWQAVVIRAVMGWVTSYRRRHQCAP